jgi:HAD superfamily hydrolase (TIGR01509 family)
MPSVAALVEAVLFDCDGVLADSEGLVNAVVAEDLTARGWRISAAQARETFLGMAAPDMIPVVEARIGRPLPRDWIPAMSLRIAEVMARELRPVEGAKEAVAAVVAAGIPVAVASNSAREELEAKLEALGLASVFAGRAFSFEDVARPKPAPDLYLAAARACGADPRRSVVVEDSLLGARAGIAAGCRVLGLAGETEAGIFAAIGAEPIASLGALPGKLGLPGAP